MKKRTLKIEERGTSYSVQHRTPMIRLKGKWLQAAGFPAGSKVEITAYAPGCLDIKFVEPA